MGWNREVNEVSRAQVTGTGEVYAQREKQKRKEEEEGVRIEREVKEGVGKKRKELVGVK